MTNKFKYIYTLFFLSMLILISGCKASIKIQAQKNLSADINFSMDLGTQIKEIINNISQLSETDAKVFDANQIKQALNKTDLQNVSIEIPSETQLNLSGTIPSRQTQTADLKPARFKISNFIDCTEHSLTLTLSASNIRELISSLPEETAAYLDLLMAPVITGEEMTVQEYKDLINVIYGNELAQELNNAQIKITLLSPERQKNKTEFSVPLAELLTLPETKTFSINF